jgi:hypothetical protein
MIEIKAFKFRIYPDDKQKEYIHNSVRTSNFIFNYSLRQQVDISDKMTELGIVDKAERKKYMKDNDLYFNMFNMSRNLTQMGNTEEFSFLKEVDATSKSYALKGIDNAFKNMVKIGSGFPKFKNITKSTYSFTGQIQYFDPTFGDLVANNSSGNFTSNTTIDNGFYRGQTSNATSQVYQVKDFRYNVLVPKISFARYLDTDVQFRVRTSTNSYSISSSFTDVLPFENNVFVDNEKAVAGRTRELASTSGNKTLTLQATMLTGNERISPVLDLGRTRSVILVNNVINNQNNGEFGNYGVADARYISKRVVLADGQEAEDIKVIISAYKPPGTDVDVFVRVQNEEDNDEFRDKHYTKLDQITSSLVFSSVTQENDYREFEYGFPSTNATSLGAFKFSGNNNVVRYFNTANAHFDTFKSFSIKVVLRSALGSHVIPRVKDLRAIALQI